MNSNRDKVMPSLYGGLLVATLWAVPGLNFINCLCCAGVLLGGFLSVLLYQKDRALGSVPLDQRDCLQLGLYTGIVASVAAVIIQIVVTAMFGDVAIDVMMRIVGKMNVDMPPEFYEMIDQARQQKPSPADLIVAVFIYMIPNSLFAVLGALIGWNVFKPKP